MRALLSFEYEVVIGDAWVGPASTSNFYRRYTSNSLLARTVIRIVKTSGFCIITASRFFVSFHAGGSVDEI